MIRIYPNETFREIQTEFPMKNRYAVSDRGRFIKFSEKFNDGEVLKGSTADGYKVFNYKKMIDGQPVRRSHFIYKLVAELFIPKTSSDQLYVLHLDYVRDNDSIRNLKWANYEEKMAHYRKSPHVINSKKKLIEHNIKADGRKLTTTSVIRLKKLLSKPNQTTRIKMLAKQFGISEMQIYRIKSGENWSHIKV